MYTFVHTHTYLCMDPYKHLYIHNSSAYTHTCYIHASIHRYIHSYTHKHKHTRARAHIQFEYVDKLKRKMTEIWH